MKNITTMKIFFVTFFCATMLVVGCVVLVYPSLKWSMNRYLSETQAQISERSAGKLVSVEELETGYFGQSKTKVTTTDGIYYVVGLVSAQDGSSAIISNRLSGDRALCLSKLNNSDGKKRLDNCYWIY